MVNSVIDLPAVIFVWECNRTIYRIVLTADNKLVVEKRGYNLDALGNESWFNVDGQVPVYLYSAALMQALNILQVNGLSPVLSISCQQDA